MTVWESGGRVLRWGIVGTGRMAATMTNELRALAAHGVEVLAVQSRDADRARRFASTHAIPRAYGSIDALARDADVDAVYIATPPAAHAGQAVTCLEHGKAVLCEKPFALNAAEASAMVAAAQSRRVFLMEALWTRFLPAVLALKRSLAEGRLGALQLLIAGGAFVPAAGPANYLFDPVLGGGALLDAGVYLLSLASLFLGLPTAVLSSAEIGPTGVDENDALLCEHPDGAKSLLYVSLRARRTPDLELLGSRGRARLGAPIFRPTELTLVEGTATPETRTYPLAGSGYGYQLLAMIEALRRGETECSLIPLAESVAILQTMDDCRRQWRRGRRAEA